MHLLLIEDDLNLCGAPSQGLLEGSDNTPLLS